MSGSSKPSNAVKVRKKAADASGHPSAVAKPATAAGAELRQFRQMDRLLGRLERRGEVLSEGADRLLKRVS
jgi:hypothetical protein